MKTIFVLCAVIFQVVLCGCGVSAIHNPVPYPAASAACVKGFSNNTSLPTGLPSEPALTPNPSTSTLWDLWRVAQTDLATQPIPYLNGSTTPPDPSAATVEPNCQAVVGVPDLTVQQLAQLTGDNDWLSHPTPSGAFICDGQAVNGCYLNGIVYVASSLDWNSEYEVANAILCHLNKCGGR